MRVARIQALQVIGRQSTSHSRASSGTIFGRNSGFSEMGTTQKNPAIQTDSPKL